jgi:hypothetical protein
MLLLEVGAAGAPLLRWPYLRSRGPAQRVEANAWLGAAEGGCVGVLPLLRIQLTHVHVAAACLHATALPARILCLCARGAFLLDVKATATLREEGDACYQTVAALAAPLPLRVRQHSLCPRPALLRKDAVAWLRGSVTMCWSGTADASEGRT